MGCHGLQKQYSSQGNFATLLEVPSMRSPYVPVLFFSLSNCNSNLNVAGHNTQTAEKYPKPLLPWRVLFGTCISNCRGAPTKRIRGI